MAGASEKGHQVGTLPQAVRRDFSAVDYGEAMRRAREIVPILRERAQQAEDARMLIRDNEQLLHESGLFRFHQPKAFGGMELEFVAVVDIPAELADGCAARRLHRVADDELAGLVAVDPDTVAVDFHAPALEDAKRLAAQIG